MLPVQLLLALGGAGLGASLFVRWVAADDGLVLFGALDRLASLEQTGWELLGWADVVFAAMAVGLVILAAVSRRRLPRPLLAAAALLCALAVATIIGHGFETTQRSFPQGVVETEPAAGPWIALAALAAALLGLVLAWVRPPRGRAARDAGTAAAAG